MADTVRGSRTGYDLRFKTDLNSGLVPYVELLGGTPTAGSLAATTAGAALSASSVPCRGVFIFQAAGDQDTLIGDSVAQTCPIPAVPFFCPVDNVNKLYAKLSANSATIPWLAIT